MKRRELLTGVGKVAAAALIAPLLPLGTIPLKPAPVTSQFHELLVWDRALSDGEISELTAYLETKYAST